MGSNPTGGTAVYLPRPAGTIGRSIDAGCSTGQRPSCPHAADRPEAGQAVERTFAWLTAHRRLARDYERDPRTSEAMIRWAAINTITRRIARGGPATRQLTPTT